MPGSRELKIVAILVSVAVLALAQPAAQREKLSRKELKSLIASARTSADHERIAAHYRAQAEQLEVKHLEHESDLAEYYKNPSRYPGKYPTMGDHCRSLAGYYKMAAGRALNLAEMHEKLAQEVR